MKLLTFLYNSSRQITLLIAFVGLLSGLFSAGLVAVINSALHSQGLTSQLLIVGFIGVVLGRMAASWFAQLLLLRFSQETIFNLCLNMCQKIGSAPFGQIEKMGVARLWTALTDDVFTLSGAIQIIPILVTNVAVLAGCSVYLIWLSWKAFLGMAILAILGTFIYNGLHKRAYRAIYLAREQRDQQKAQFRALTEGIKELKMHSSRKEAFLSEHIKNTAESLKAYNLISGKQFILVDSWGQILFYGILGAFLVFSQFLTTFSHETLTGYVFATLYVMPPLRGIIGSVPTFYRGQISLTKIEELGISLVKDALGDAPSQVQLPSSQKIALELKNIQYSFEGGGNRDHAFTLGPINLTIQSGETVFVIGGNGSGKSTLVKLLVGLYSPDSGDIFLGGTRIREENREWYRQHFSVVFSDFFLFEDLMGLISDDLDGKANEYLKRLELDKKVSVVNKKFSTIALSMGQRKRLALLAAYLEDRPIYVFDEWASDQDPYFKDIFYKELLPELKNRGKTVLVVTHDDRYFDRGDRIIKLEDGHLKEGFFHPVEPTVIISPLMTQEPEKSEVHIEMPIKKKTYRSES